MAERATCIADLHRGYHAGRECPRSVVAAAIERIQSREHTLNAWTLVDSDRALADADGLRSKPCSGGDSSSLHGAPIAIKDVMHVRGWRTTFGSRLHDPAPAKEDAAAVKRLREAGAVLAGKTNCLEYGYGVAHPDFGQTRNPWNVGRTAGGSSGGSAAAVAAGQVLGATGTDTGGSIRIPAAYCGVVGLKPTYGLVPLDGVAPLSWSLDHAGPLAPTCADAALLLEVMSARRCRPQPCTADGLRFLMIREQVEDTELRPDVARALESALHTLASAGATIRYVSISDLRYADDALMNVIAPEASVIHADRLERRPEAFAAETRMQLELGFAIPAVTHVRAQRYRRHLGQRLVSVLADADALIGPTVPSTAGANNPRLDDPAGAAEMRYIAPYNLTGLPALTLPCGMAPDGLPVGLQLAAPPHTDERLLSIGACLEALFAVDGAGRGEERQ